MDCNCNIDIDSVEDWKKAEEFLKLNLLDE